MSSMFSEALMRLAEAAEAVNCPIELEGEDTRDEGVLATIGAACLREYGDEPSYQLLVALRDVAARLRDPLPWLQRMYTQAHGQPAPDQLCREALDGLLLGHPVEFACGRWTMAAWSPRPTATGPTMLFLAPDPLSASAAAHRAHRAQLAL